MEQGGCRDGSRGRVYTGVPIEAKPLNKDLTEGKELVGATQERGFWMEGAAGSPQ